jgi:hypothetical protein
MQKWRHSDPAVNRNHQHAYTYTEEYSTGTSWYTQQTCMAIVREHNNMDYKVVMMIWRNQIKIRDKKMRDCKYEKWAANQSWNVVYYDFTDATASVRRFGNLDLASSGNWDTTKNLTVERKSPPWLPYTSMATKQQTPRTTHVKVSSIMAGRRRMSTNKSKGTCRNSLSVAMTDLSGRNRALSNRTRDPKLIG